jgi:hypothetical protein
MRLYELTMARYIPGVVFEYEKVVSRCGRRGADKAW